MGIIEELRVKFFQDKFEFSKHAVDRTILREISIREIRDAIHTGEVIEDYPDDKYGPSCLIYGMTHQNRPIHIQCSYPSQPIVKVITVYQPDPAQWIDCRIRR